MILLVELKILVLFMRAGIAMSRYVVLVFVNCTAGERC